MLTKRRMIWFAAPAAAACRMVPVKSLFNVFNLVQLYFPAKGQFVESLGTHRQSYSIEIIMKTITRLALVSNAVLHQP